MKVLALLQKIDAAAETALFDVVPRLARRAGLVLAFLVLGLLTAGIYRQAPDIYRQAPDIHRQAPASAAPMSAAPRPLAN